MPTYPGLKLQTTWDARNCLSTIKQGSGRNATTIGSFAYDPLGRRVSKTIGASTTSFLYDGQNPVQELSGTTPAANILAGLGIDEYFSLYCPS
jgi:YD repeat-containing protein